MSYNLIGYQQTAVDELTKKVTKLLNSDYKHTTCVFQSPTGSGKTIMTAKLIEAILEDNQDTDIVFLWISIGKGELHKQSKEKLEAVYEGFPPVNLVEERYFGDKHTIRPNEVVVVNWENINRKKRDENTGEMEWVNILMKDGEKINFREVLANTKARFKIICIIDESHIGADSIRTQELMEIIDADVTIEVSATPKFELKADDILEGKADKYKVNPTDVIEAGMIKKDLIINPDLDKIEDSEINSQDAILLAAFNKRLKLKEQYENEGSNVNPLVLIQLPTGEDGETKKTAVTQWLEAHGVSLYNQKLGVWLNEEKTANLKYISKNDDKTEFLIFKQAIDTGWDCPRACILVKFRESGNQVFEIQTVGRILRMPEQKHYDNEELNSGYIYSNLQSFSVKREEYNPNIIKSLYTVKKPELENIELNSYYKQRSDYGDITSSFTNHLLDVWNTDLGLKEALLFEEVTDILKAMQIDLNVANLEDEIVFDYQINTIDFDQLQNHKIESEDIKIFKTAENDLDSYFKRYIKLNLSGFAPRRSTSNVETAIYIWFRQFVGIPSQNGGIIKMQKITLHPANHIKFNQLLDKAVKSYKSIKDIEVRERAESSEKFSTIPLLEKDYFNSEITEIRPNTKLYFYEKCILEKSRSTQEKAFEDYLESSPSKINWWYKNGISKDTYFGIKYFKDTADIAVFYPDYIVKFADGRIGIFDTKSGNTAKEAKQKAEALQEYIKTNNDQNLFGGIVTNTGTPENIKLMINSNDIYFYDGRNWDEWKYVSEII
jgi:type III restriction enzyme